MQQQPLRKTFRQRVHFALAKHYFRWVRPMTLGARTAVIDGEGRFLLVRHTYAPGWAFPGGGVERGETCHDAALRELREEAAIEATGSLALHGVFSNEEIFKGDHVALFVLRSFVQHDFQPDGEIAEARFFLPAEMPKNAVTAGTLRRVDEIREKRPPSPHW